MALLTIDMSKIINNVKQIDDYLSKQDISWTIIIKVLSGHKPTIRKLISNPVIKKVGSVGDSQLSSLRLIKKIDSDIETVYMKPPVISTAKKVITHADVSYNTSYRTLRELDKEAKAKNKIHDVILMVEMGEIREGFNPDELFELFPKLLKLENLRIRGLGTNLGCMFGVKPSYKKLNFLVSLKHKIEQAYEISIPIISGGTTLTLPLTKDSRFSKELNHFRIGGGVFMGSSARLTKKIKNIATDAFTFSANVLEFRKKNNSPTGKLKDSARRVATSRISEDHFRSKQSFKALVDFGLLDLDANTIIPKDDRVKFVASTSDVTVYNLGNDYDVAKKYKVGKRIYFNLTYISLATLMYSPYVTKRVFCFIKKKR